MDYVSLMGYAAAVLTTVSFIPQALKTIKTKDTKSISLFMYSLFTLGTLFWFCFGLFSHNTQVALANGVTLVFACIILVYKFKYK